MSEDGKSIRFPPGLLQQIDQLVDMNIYGGSRSEIVRRFVNEGIERISNDGTIKNVLETRGLLAQAKRENIKPITKKSGAI